MEQTSEWSWEEGVVDPAGEHLALCHNGFGEEVVALVGPQHDRVFPVEFVRPPNADETTLARALADVRRELDFYLTDVGRPDPWAYAHYHCGTSSNLYSTVHWTSSSVGDSSGDSAG